MNILLAGDSNFRDLFTCHRDQIEKDVGEKIKFEMVTSVASLGVLMDGQVKMPEVVIVSPPTNEIAMKSRNNTKSREGIVEAVVTDFYNLLVDKSVKNDSTLFIVTQPFLRLDPPGWIRKLNSTGNFSKQRTTTTAVATYTWVV